MNSEERFKKSLEDLLASKEFTFDEANWDKARNIIDASKERKRRVLPYIVAGIVLLLSLGTGAYLLWDASAASEKLAENAACTSQTLEVPSSPEIYTTTETPETGLAGNAERVQKPAQPAGEKQPAINTEKKPVTTKTPVINEEPVIKETPVAAPDKKIVKNNGAALAVKPVVKTPAQDDHTTPETKPERSTPANNPAEIVSENPTVVKSNEGNETPGNISDGNSSVATTTPVVPANVQVPAEETTSGKKENDLNTAVNEQNVTAVPVQADPELKTKTEAPAEKAALSPALATTDSVKNNGLQLVDPLPADNDQGELGKQKQYPILFSVEAGANYMYGWQNPGTKDAGGFNPVVGVNYFNNFTPKMNVSFGIQYTSVGKLSYSSYTSRVTRFALGEESKVSVFTPVKVHYLVVPLRFSYNLNTRNTFGLGCNVAYLLNVESEVETYTEKLNGKYDQSLTKTTGYTQGFKKYDTQASAFYKRTLYPSLALNLEVFYGLTDIKDNAFFKSGVFERNSGLKLTLVYNFLKK